MSDTMQVPDFFNDLAREMREKDERISTLEAYISKLEAEVERLKASDEHSRAELRTVIAEYGNAKNEMREERSKFYVERERLKVKAALLEDMAGTFFKGLSAHSPASLWSRYEAL